MLYYICCLATGLHALTHCQLRISIWPIVQCCYTLDATIDSNLHLDTLINGNLESLQLLVASVLATLGRLRAVGILNHIDPFVKASNNYTTSCEHYYDYRTVLQRFAINIARQSHSTQWRLDTTSVRFNRADYHDPLNTDHLKWFCIGINTITMHTVY